MRFRPYIGTRIGPFYVGTSMTTSRRRTTPQPKPVELTARELEIIHQRAVIDANEFQRTVFERHDRLAEIPALEDEIAAARKRLAELG